MMVLGATFTVFAFMFIAVSVMAAANGQQEDGKIMALVAIACAILGTGFLG